jgi:hypothetical protein
MELDVLNTSRDVSSNNDCLICITKCDTLSSDLFLYNCTCVYYVHKNCMINWRQIAKTDRICLICPVTITDEKELQIIPYRPPGLLERDRFFIGNVIRFIFVPFTCFTIIGGLMLIISCLIEKIFKVQLRNR